MDSSPDTDTGLWHAVLGIEYDGTDLAGWARQVGRRSVEGELLAALEACSLTAERHACAGRTDAGVHASAQVASLAYRGSVPPERLQAALNTHLPRDVRIVTSAAASPGFDARRDATSRSYEYRVLVRRAPSPLRRHRVLHHPRPLDLDQLRAAAAAIRGQHDFTAFTPSRTEHVFFHRTVLEADWQARGDELVFSITADAFLRHMVRILVGTMLAVGTGSWPLERLVGLLDGASRSAAWRTAPPHGLCLMGVDYPPGAATR